MLHAWNFDNLQINFGDTLKRLVNLHSVLWNLLATFWPILWFSDNCSLKSNQWKNWNATAHKMWLKHAIKEANTWWRFMLCCWMRSHFHYNVCTKILIRTACQTILNTDKWCALLLSEWVTCLWSGLIRPKKDPAHNHICVWLRQMANWIHK